VTGSPLPKLPEQPVRLRTGQAVDRLTATAEKAKQYAERARSTNTRRAYKADWDHFAAFCDSHGLTALPAAPETLGLYLTELAETGYKASTLQRRLSAIREAHRIARHVLDTDHPAVREVWRGIRGVIGTAKTPKAPFGAGRSRCRPGTDAGRPGWPRLDRVLRRGPPGPARPLQDRSAG
jgi:hypothetical protein